MKRFSKTIYALWVVIVMFAYIGTASAVKNLVVTMSNEVKLEAVSKDIPPEYNLKNSLFKENRGDYISSFNRMILPVFKNGYDFSHALCSEKPNTTLELLLTSNEFCENKSYAHSVLHVLTKGFSQSFLQILKDVSLVLSGGSFDFASNIKDIDFFTGYFYDLITGRKSFDYLNISDEFFRLFDSSLHLRRQQHAKCDSITKNFLCDKKQAQDPGKFITGVLTILGIEKSPLITSQVDIRPFHAKYNDSGNMKFDMEELTAVQTISLEKYARKADGFFDSLCTWRYCEQAYKEVSLHVDTEKFSHLIVKFNIFIDSLDDKGNLSTKKAPKKKRKIINLSENVIIQVSDIKDVGCANKKHVVRYCLTPIAAISQRGGTLSGGHFIAKIFTEKSGDDSKWTVYKNNKELSAQKRSELATDYDDYIIVYKADKVLDK